MYFERNSGMVVSLFLENLNRLLHHQTRLELAPKDPWLCCRLLCVEITILVSHFFQKFIPFISTGVESPFLTHALNLQCFFAAKRRQNLPHQTGGLPYSGQGHALHVRPFVPKSRKASHFLESPDCVSEGVRKDVVVVFIDDPAKMWSIKQEVALAVGISFRLSLKVREVVRVQGVQYALLPPMSPKADSNLSLRARRTP